MTEIIIAILGLLSTALGIVLTHQLSKRKELETKLYDNRRQLYLKLLEPFIDSFKNTILKRPLKPLDRLSAELVETNTNLSMFASDNVIKAFNEFKRNAIKAEQAGKKDSKQILYDYAKIIIEIRKDLGNPTTELNEKDILQGFITDLL